MQNQIVCPNCQTPFATEVTQVIDVGKNPELKSMLLSGRLNVAMCPNCNAGIQMASPMIYHDPENELFMAYVPMELNLPHVEQEKLIGELVRNVMDNIPPAERRAYMLQPMTVINLQTFLEKVLETEGVTPEMLQRQRRQAELLQTMSTANSDEITRLLEVRKDEIDETFFAMMEAALQEALQGNNQDQIVKLTNLQARLYRETEIGRTLEKQRVTLRRFQNEARKQGGLSPELMLKHIVENERDDDIVDAIAQIGSAGLTYQFFQLLSTAIEGRERKGDKEGAQRLRDHRERLLEAQESAREESRQIIEAANETMQAILDAPDQRQAVRDHMEEIDDAFMYLLHLTLSQAEQSGNRQQANQLRDIQQLISDEIESQLPPEIKLINQLASTTSVMEQNRLLDEHPQMVNANLVGLLRMVAKESREGGDDDFAQRMEGLAKMVNQRILTA